MDGGFELVSGERRLRAASMAGLQVVPCYIITVSDQESALMALLENLQRKDLDCFEEAMFLRRLCSEFHMTQQDAAKRVGKTQSAVANKMRLLKLSPETGEVVRQYLLSERHARALLQVEEEDARLQAARQMGQKHMTVAQAEAFIQRLLEEKPKPRRQGMIRDVRLFCNSVNNALEIMRRAGVEAESTRRETDDATEILIRIPKG